MRNVAFFGATGGCANACLVQTLLNSHNAVALVRSASKLKGMIASKVPKDTVGNLEIVEGDVTDVESVSRTLRHAGKEVDTIISGIGTSSQKWKPGVD
jgi:putative NADH-flavin reductase